MSDNRPNLTPPLVCGAIAANAGLRAYFGPNIWTGLAIIAAVAAVLIASTLHRNQL